MGELEVEQKKKRKKQLELMLGLTLFDKGTSGTPGSPSLVPTSLSLARLSLSLSLSLICLYAVSRVLVACVQRERVMAATGSSAASRRRATAPSSLYAALCPI
jgi:hypothetical protein